MRGRRGLQPCGELVPLVCPRPMLSARRGPGRICVAASGARLHDAVLHQPRQAWRRQGLVPFLLSLLGVDQWPRPEGAVWLRGQAPTSQGRGFRESRPCSSPVNSSSKGFPELSSLEPWWPRPCPAHSQGPPTVEMGPASSNSGHALWGDPKPHPCTPSTTHLCRSKPGGFRKPSLL